MAWLAGSAGASETWFLGATVGALLLVGLLLLAVTHTPIRGRAHDGLEALRAWLEARPGAAVHAAFSTLAAATLLHYLAVSYIWVSGPERTRALGASEAITATALPVVVFLVASVAARGAECQQSSRSTVYWCASRSARTGTRVSCPHFGCCDVGTGGPS